MIRLDSRTLSETTLNRLSGLQSRVNMELTFALKASRAGSLWDNKTSSNPGKAAFKEIAETLKSMCVSVEVCNYCEQNEANDIEHIYPKSLFPGWAFSWDNYLLACKQCNTAYKLDSFAVLDDHDDLIDVPRGSEPPTHKGAFINPRAEDPAAYLMMNLGSFKFEKMPDLDQASKHKADKTVEILQLNDRAALIAARKSAAQYYYQRMEMLVRIQKAGSQAEIEAIISPYDDYLATGISLSQLKDQIKTGFMKDIRTHQHPSVWHAIRIVMSKVDQKWKQIFQEIPEALNW